MATATPATTACPVCDHAMPTDPGECPNCHASAAWIELLGASDFVNRVFKQWREESQLNSQTYEKVTGALLTERQRMLGDIKNGRIAPALLGPPSNECWSCKERCAGAPPFCGACGAPMAGPGVRSLRRLGHLHDTIEKLEGLGCLSLAEAHGLRTDARERIAALRRKLDRERLPTGQPVADHAEKVTDATPDGSNTPARLASRRLLEILLDPRSIQWLLMSGAVLLVVGLSIYLWAIGIFENRKTIAVALGLGTATMLGGGWAVIKYTRFQTAGRALTLLACLIMPLNLWFYHANNLITLQGQLWVPAMVCCLAYAASALVLRDELFDHRNHRCLQIRLVLILALTKPLAVVVSLERPEKRKSFRAEIRGAHGWTPVR